MKKLIVFFALLINISHASELFFFKENKKLLFSYNPERQLIISKDCKHCQAEKALKKVKKVELKSGGVNPAAIICENQLKTKVVDIIQSQKSDPRYEYASYEQIEIDKLVYEAYGLNADDVQEVENWYARRYSKLSAAQKANLRKLGKSDDYLELYGMK